jgi:hypothetical protein
MTQPIPDLWPEIEQSGEVPPVAILREQAALLGHKTHNLLQGRVDTRIAPGGLFVHSFYIVAPTLDNYIYKLFEIEHGVNPYPVVSDEQQFYKAPAPLRLKSEQDLLHHVREILNSDQTKRILGSLLAQVKATS